MRRFFSGIFSAKDGPPTPGPSEAGKRGFHWAKRRAAFGHSQSSTESVDGAPHHGGVNEGDLLGVSRVRRGSDSTPGPPMTSTANVTPREAPRGPAEQPFPPHAASGPAVTAHYRMALPCPRPLALGGVSCRRGLL
ncbi:hypothetical protein Z043_124936 [Scleropages formosus]|uniref:Uncharacterized protein n=1 Tax=Scleropages formosus TaxID=113540 RepID=A0A0P7TUR9_SCLFO|nr:hypothetical protein Z043_124936 [Scleropages formosus]